MTERPSRERRNGPFPDNPTQYLAFDAVRIDLVERSLDGIWDWQIPSGYTYYSDEWKLALGYEPHELENDIETWYRVLHEDDTARAEEALRRHFELDEPYQLVLRYRRKDGSIAWMTVRGQAIRGPGGEVVRMAGTHSDVTALEEARAELVAKTKELEASRARLERSHTELEEFAYIAAHDLREPLRGISNFAEFLIEDHAKNLDADGLRLLGRLPVLARRLEHQVERLLEITRYGRMGLSIEPLDLGPLVGELTSDLGAQLEAARVRLIVEGELPLLRCDRSTMTHVLRNLVSNAIKYSDKHDDRWIRIGTAPREIAESLGAPRPASAQLIYVEDNGLGIEPKHHESIFKIFRRLHPRESFGGGVGVGLTIAKRMVERHGGAIWLRSEPGRGSCFYFYLDPLALQDPEMELVA